MEIQQHQLSPGVKRMRDESVGDDILLQIPMLLTRPASPDVLNRVRILGVIFVLGVLICIFAIRIKDNLSDSKRRSIPTQSKHGLQNDLGGVGLTCTRHAKKRRLLS